MAEGAAVKRMSAAERGNWRVTERRQRAQHSWRKTKGGGGGGEAEEHGEPRQ
jgi:hypothetical protein